jgi:pyrroloquinoline-quinone synthase
MPGGKGGAAMVGDVGRTVGAGCQLSSAPPDNDAKGSRLSTAIWERIEDARSDWNALCHPFYERWSAGELTLEELGSYSGQYRHAVGAIAEMSAAAASSAPDRPELARHAAEELGHVRLWDGFVAAVGGSVEDEPTPETAQCVDTWTGDRELLPTLAKLYAIESGQPEISRTKREGLRDFYGIEEGAGTAYFTVHESRDTQHAAEVRELIEELARDADADGLVSAATAAFRANWRLLDGV